MPGQDGLVDIREGGWCTQSDEYLRVLIFFEIMIHYYVYFEVLTDGPHYWSVGRGKLPVDAVIEHVQEYNYLVSHTHIIVAKQLNKQFFNPLQLGSIVGNLSKEERLLEIFKQLLGFRWLSPTEVVHVFVVGLLCEGELPYVLVYLLEELSEALQALKLQAGLYIGFIKSLKGLGCVRVIRTDV